MKNTVITSPPADRLIGFRSVNELLGSRCKTSHFARSLAAGGKIKAIRLSDRCIRFSEASVLAFVGGQGQ